MHNQILLKDDNMVGNSKINKLKKRAYRSLERLAKKCEKLAKTYPDPEDKDFVKMYLDDAKDYRKIKELLKQNKFKKAASFVAWMDTAPREEIPNYLYNFLLDTYHQG